jgi:hypothetical protein
VDSLFHLECKLQTNLSMKCKANMAEEFFQLILDISNTHEVITDTSLAEDTTQTFKCFPRYFRLLDNNYFILQITDNDLAIII